MISHCGFGLHFPDGSWYCLLTYLLTPSVYSLEKYLSDPLIYSRNEWIMKVVWKRAERITRKISRYRCLWVIGNKCVHSNATLKVTKDRERGWCWSWDLWQDSSYHRVTWASCQRARVRDNVFWCYRNHMPSGHVCNYQYIEGRSKSEVIKLPLKDCSQKTKEESDPPDWYN